MSTHELLKLAVAIKSIDPFELILRGKAVIPTPEKVDQASRPKREKDIEKKR